MDKDTRTLSKQLIDKGYRELFMRYDYSSVDKLWSKPGTAEAIKKLVQDPHAPHEAIFLAAEALFIKDKDFPQQALTHRLAAIYADALANDYTNSANPWGLPDNVNGEPGKHFIQLGEAAVPELVKLLDNKKSLVYEGSEEATVGNSYQYRVKDFAAFYLSKITGLPYTVHKEPANRDEEIKKLQQAIKNK